MSCDLNFVRPPFESVRSTPSDLAKNLVNEIVARGGVSIQGNSTVTTKDVYTVSAVGFLLWKDKSTQTWKECSRCPTGSFEETRCSEFADVRCRVIRACIQGEYVFTKATEQSDTVCKRWTRCGDRTVEDPGAPAPGPFTDRTCIECSPPDTYRSPSAVGFDGVVRPACVATTICMPGSEETKPPSKVSVFIFDRC